MSSEYVAITRNFRSSFRFFFVAGVGVFLPVGDNIAAENVTFCSTNSSEQFSVSISGQTHFKNKEH